MLEELKKLGFKLYKDIIIERAKEEEASLEAMPESEPASNFHLLSEDELTSYRIPIKEYEEAMLIKVEPSFRKNAGFFFVQHSAKEGGSFSLSIILKGYYQDNIRHILGESRLDWQNWSSLTNLLFDAERKLERLLSFEIMLIGGECFIKSCNDLGSAIPSYEELYKDMRDFHIPRPLSESEYAEPKSRIYEEDDIFSANYLSFFPQHLSTLSASILADLQDILNPIFLSCNLKAETPSSALLFGRCYANLTNIEKLFKTIGLNKSLYRLSFAPQLYLKMHSHHLAKLSTTFFPITLEEVTELLTALKTGTNDLTIESIKDKSYIDMIAQFMIIYQYITVIFTDKLSRLLKYFPDISLLLNAIYKTRESSLFYSTEELLLAETVDLLSPLKKVQFNLERKPEKLKFFIKSLPFFKRKKGKIKKNIAKLHALLNLRDELYLAISAFIEKLQPILLEIEPNIIKLFFSEHDELRKKSYGGAMADLGEVQTFRKWKWFRENAALVPPEVYARDLTDIPKISEEMLSKLLEKRDIKAMAFNKSLETLEVGSDIFAAYNLPITALNEYSSKKGFILEACSTLSFATEFAILTNKALYTGIPFAKLSLSGKLSLKNHGIDIER